MTITIPPEAVKAAETVLGPKETEERKLLAAALSAYPELRASFPFHLVPMSRLILPLPTENTDAEG